MQRSGKQAPSPLERLAGLVNNGKPLTEEDVTEMEEQDKEAIETIDKVLAFVAQQPGCDNIFTAQELVEACAEELRNQIRDQVEGDDGEG